MAETVLKKRNRTPYLPTAYLARQWPIWRWKLRTGQFWDYESWVKVRKSDMETSWPENHYSYCLYLSPCSKASYATKIWIPRSYFLKLEPGWEGPQFHTFKFSRWLPCRLSGMGPRMGSWSHCSGIQGPWRHEGGCRKSEKPQTLTYMQGRDRDTEVETCGCNGGRRGWDELRE